MKQVQKIFIIGHHGGGKVLLAKRLAEILVWRFANADIRARST